MNYKPLQWVAIRIVFTVKARLPLQDVWVYPHAMPNSAQEALR